MLMSRRKPADNVQDALMPDANIWETAMNMGLPICTQPAAYRMLAEQLHTLGSSDALLNGAIAIASHHLPDLDPAAIDQQIQDHANAVRSRVRSTRRQVLVAHLHDYLFDELGFAGNR